MTEEFKTKISKTYNFLRFLDTKSFRRQVNFLSDRPISVLKITELINKKGGDVVPTDIHYTTSVSSRLGREIGLDLFDVKKTSASRRFMLNPDVIEKINRATKHVQ